MVTVVDSDFKISLFLCFFSSFLCTRVVSYEIFVLYAKQDSEDLFYTTYAGISWPLASSCL